MSPFAPSAASAPTDLDLQESMSRHPDSSPAACADAVGGANGLIRQILHYGEGDSTEKPAREVLGDYLYSSELDEKNVS